MKVWIIIVIVIISILIIGFGLGLLYLNFNPEITCGFSKDLDKKNGCYYNAAQKSQDFNFCDNIID
jgi:hypothetical protein